MLRDLRERRLLITGASSGLGRCLAEQAVQLGARVALVARKAERLEALAHQLSSGGADVVALPGDITQDADRRRILDQAVEHFHGLDGLINNAGVASFAHFADSDETVLRQIMELNFFAPVELTRLAIPVLTKGQQPIIVNIASMCGRRPLPAWTEYSASKSALCGWSEALRGEMVRFGIDVLVALPGLTRTDLGTNLLRHTGRMNIDFSKGMAPADVAAEILKAVGHNRAEAVIGRDAVWMLRANRFFPRLVNRLLTRKVGQLYARS